MTELKQRRTGFHACSKLFKVVIVTTRVLYHGHIITLKTYFCQSLYCNFYVIYKLAVLLVYQFVLSLQYIALFRSKNWRRYVLLYGNMFLKTFWIRREHFHCGICNTVIWERFLNKLPCFIIRNARTNRKGL